MYLCLILKVLPELGCLILTGPSALGRVTVRTDSETKFQREDVFPTAHGWQSQGLQVSPSEPVGHPCAMQAKFTCSKEAGRKDPGQGRAGSGAVWAEEEEPAPWVGNPGRFLFICPRRVSHCVFAAAAVQGSALCHIGHVQPQLLVIHAHDPVICSGKGYDLLVPRIPQTGQHLELPLEILLVPAHPGVLGILQKALQRFSLSATHQGPLGPLLHKA